MRRGIRDFVDGVRLVPAGFRVWRSSPRLMVIGLIPGLITSLLLAGFFVAIALWADDWARDIAAGVTGDATPNGLLVALLVVALIGGGAFLGIYAFAAVTLLIGQPFFEAISDRVAASVGLEFSVDEEAWWRSTARGIGEGTVLLLIGGAIGIAAFLVGLIPIVGTATAFVTSVLVGGTLLGLELTAYPLQRVGVFRLRDRRRVVNARRPLALGFSVAAYLICLVPFGAVLAMPALVAGGTLLAARDAPPGAIEG